MERENKARGMEDDGSQRYISILIRDTISIIEFDLGSFSSLPLSQRASLSGCVFTRMG